MSSPLESGAYRKVRAPSPGRSMPIVPTSDFSGFVSSDCALASAAASAAIDSLDRCMAGLRFQDVEAHRSGSRPAGTDSMADRLLGVFRDQSLEFGLGALVLEVRLPRAAEDPSELGPAVGGVHIDDPHHLNSWPGRINQEQPRGLATLNTAPELFLGRQQEVLAKTIDEITADLRHAFNLVYKEYFLIFQRSRTEEKSFAPCRCLCRFRGALSTCHRRWTRLAIRERP